MYLYIKRLPVATRAWTAFVITAHCHQIDCVID